ncbi:MAG: trypsin-like peptidase domain-containing protein [Porticoccaceae bacterium]|nr:trypsin-like peptidase domain-containing protein [Porticoccaceae bacterium]
MMKRNSLFALTALLASSLMLSAHAGQIYKYKDKNGRWVYTDKKPGDDKNAATIGEQKTSNSNTDSDPKVDLKQELETRYATDSAELKASLAVVTVRTSTGTGSGFFVTDNGYLVTNKHVVRPKGFSNWQQQEQQLNREQHNLKQRFSNLKEEKSRIASNERTLRQMKESLENPGLYRNPPTREEYETHMTNHKQRQKDYKRKFREARQQERELKKRQRDFALAGSSASVAKRFTLILKDGRRLKANLVKVSKNHDLALLKLNGYHTPFLTPADYKWPRQSQPVFAIGSPLSENNSITAGKVTSVKKDRILVDAMILSGNSGGPLVDDNGDLLGVNTQRLIDHRFNGANSFGVAIPQEVVIEEFGKYIGNQ